MSQGKKYFVDLLLILEGRRLERLQEVQVEITRRLRGRAFIGCAKEQITAASGFALAPRGRKISPVVNRCTAKAWMMRNAVGLYPLRAVGNAC